MIAPTMAYIETDIPAGMDMRTYRRMANPPRATVRSRLAKAFGNGRTPADTATRGEW